MHMLHKLHMLVEQLAITTCLIAKLLLFIDSSTQQKDTKKPIGFHRICWFPSLHAISFLLMFIAVQGTGAQGRPMIQQETISNAASDAPMAEIRSSMATISIMTNKRKR